MTDFLTQVLPALLIVIGLPLGILWWSRRSRVGVPGRLNVTDRAAFGRATWVAVVEVDRRRFLVGAGEHGVNLISELDEAPALPEGEPVAGLPYTDDPRATDSTRTDRPRSGLIRRLQQMTLRVPAESSWRPLRDRRS